VRRAHLRSAGHSDNVLARYYTQGERHGSTIAYYAQDQIGSVVATVDPQGQITSRLRYDSYGTLTSSSGTLPDYRYAGLYAHPQSGVYLATYRAYDPKIGRWLSRDPIREAGGLNLYGYVAQNPLSHRDPLGLLNPAEAACIAGPNPVCAGGLVGDAVTTVVGVGIIVYNHYHSESSDEAESCPSTNPDDWEKIPHSRPPAYRPKGGKEPVFQGDRSGDRGHGGSNWKKWDKYRDWKAGGPRNGTYDVNGRKLRK
jgi:RHS repeat-associated protein